MINIDPEFLEQNIIQYPDLYLEFNNATCVVNYSYAELDIFQEEFVKKNVTVTKYIPSAIKSIDDLYELLETLHNNSEEQNIYYKRKINATTRSKSILSLILGLPLCVIPPLGLYLIIKGVLGLMGLLKKEVVCCYQLPQIKISSNYSSKENMIILNSFIHEFKRNDRGSDISSDRYFSNLHFDDGSKLLLLTYEFTPEYSTHYQYENKDGTPDLRYKNNPQYSELEDYLFELTIPGELGKYAFFAESTDCEDMLNYLKKIVSDAEIKKIKLGRDISESSHEQAENGESAEHVIESEENYTIIGDSQDEMEFDLVKFSV